MADATPRLWDAIIFGPVRSRRLGLSLGVNLTPRDGIDGGEWDDDIAQNIAPVLGAFVRGKYPARREAWKAVRGSGMRL